MSRHDQIRKFQNFTGGSMTGTSVITSIQSSIQFVDDIGIELVWTGSPVGNFQVQVSADYDPNQEIAGSWIPLLFTYWNGTLFVTSYSIPTSLASPYYIDIPLTSAPWIRVQYTNTSGTGTLNSFLTAKAV
jgi:hypothetical protein